MEDEPRELADHPVWGQEQFRVPKTPVQVELTLEGGERIAGKVFVLPTGSPHEGREKVIELLEEPQTFMPVQTERESRLVQKRRIVAIRVEGQYDAGLEDPYMAAIPRAAVVIHLVGLPDEVAAIEGTLRLNMPPGQMRVLDYLNHADHFFPLETATGVALVAKRYVRDLRQV